MAKSCDACEKLREVAPALLNKGVTPKMQENLANNEGLNENDTRLDCEDLNAMNECLIGGIIDVAEQTSSCNWRDLINHIVAQMYGMFKAIIAAICGLWDKVEKLTHETGSLKLTTVSWVNSTQNGSPDPSSSGYPHLTLKGGTWRLYINPRFETSYKGSAWEGFSFDTCGKEFGGKGFASDGSFYGGFVLSNKNGKAVCYAFIPKEDLQEVGVSFLWNNDMTTEQAAILKGYVRFYSNDGVCAQQAATIPSPDGLTDFNPWRTRTIDGKSYNANEYIIMRAAIQTVICGFNPAKSSLNEGLIGFGQLTKRFLKTN